MDISEWWQNVDYPDQRRLKAHSHGEPLNSDLRLALAKAGREGDETHLTKEEWHFIERAD